MSHVTRNYPPVHQRQERNEIRERETHAHQDDVLPAVTQSSIGSHLGSILNHGEDLCLVARRTMITQRRGLIPLPGIET
jgi:hypothetical protein